MTCRAARPDDEEHRRIALLDRLEIIERIARRQGAPEEHGARVGVIGQQSAIRRTLLDDIPSRPVRDQIGFSQVIFEQAFRLCSSSSSVAKLW